MTNNVSTELLHFGNLQQLLIYHTDRIQMFCQLSGAELLSLENYSTQMCFGGK